MPSNKFILGRYDDRAFTADDISESADCWEGDGVSMSDIITTFYTNPRIFSNHTERDEMQAEGILYKGTVDDE